MDFSVVNHRWRWLLLIALGGVVLLTHTACRTTEPLPDRKPVLTVPQQEPTQEPTRASDRVVVNPEKLLFTIVNEALTDRVNRDYLRELHSMQQIAEGGFNAQARINEQLVRLKERLPYLRAEEGLYLYWARDPRGIYLPREYRVVGPALMHCSGLRRIERSRSHGSPWYQINLYFTSGGDAAFRDLTRRYQGRRLAIVVDGMVVTDPTIVSEVESGVAAIIGYFSELESDLIARSIEKCWR